MGIGLPWIGVFVFNPLSDPYLHEINISRKWVNLRGFQKPF